MRCTGLQQQRVWDLALRSNSRLKHSHSCAARPTLIHKLCTSISLILYIKAHAHTCLRRFSWLATYTLRNLRNYKLKINIARASACTHIFVRRAVKLVHRSSAISCETFEASRTLCVRTCVHVCTCACACARACTYKRAYTHACIYVPEFNTQKRTRIRNDIQSHSSDATSWTSSTEELAIARNGNSIENARRVLSNP